MLMPPAPIHDMVVGIFVFDAQWAGHDWDIVVLVINSQYYT